MDEVDHKARHDIDAKIDQVYRPLVGEGVTFACHIRIGREYNEILDHLAEHPADLLVLGRHGHGGLSGMFASHVVDKVVGRAPCAVLVVPTCDPASRPGSSG